MPIRDSNISTPYSSLNRYRRNHAPYLEVRLSPYGINAPQTFLSKALLDTGSSHTVIPTEILELIGASPTGIASIKGLSQQVEKVATYDIEISLCDCEYLREVIEVREWTKGREFILIGRDFLNKYGFLFDGIGIASKPLTCHIWHNG